MSKEADLLKEIEDCRYWLQDDPDGTTRQKLQRLELELKHHQEMSQRISRSKAARLHGYQVFGAKVGGKRITRGTLPANHGLHAGRHLIVSMEAADLIQFRPLNSPAKWSISAFDVYQIILEREAAAARAERDAERKRKIFNPVIGRLRKKARK